MSRVLIAVISCHTHRERANAQRGTWVKDFHAQNAAADLRFFLGRGALEPLPDEVHLEVDDGYEGLPAKSQAVFRWAYERDYDFIFKCDDDVYVRPERLLGSGFETYDYMGRLRGASGKFPAPYASGFAYWLSRRGMEIVARANLNGDGAEDRFVGNTLFAKGIVCRPDYRYAVVSSQHHAVSYYEGPRQGNTVIAACEYGPKEMELAHEAFMKAPALVSDLETATGPLSKVCIMVKTFLRDGYLFRAIEGIETKLPEAKIVLVDDGYESKQKITLYANLRRKGHVCVWMAYDSGFGAKSNAAIPFCDRPYVLVGSDDFNFGALTCRPGIELLINVLDSDPEIGVASGRVNGRPYEAKLEIDGSFCKEIPGYYETRKTPMGVEYKLCDLTVNYSLIRREVLKKVHWDDDVKIGGGEHGSFFIDVKRAGWKVAFVPGVEIGEQPFEQYKQALNYQELRNRAKLPGRPCLKRRGIEKYITMGGHVELA